jgi:glycosyltransferase involved in cell wall biosynthesis
MRIALVAPPFIPVPPRRYGGTELFIAHLAHGLHRLGHDVVVYANGESRLRCEVRSLYPRGEWPVRSDINTNLKDLNHTAWACADAAGCVDIIHLNNSPGLAFSRLLAEPIVYTIHHAKEQALSDFYASYPDVTYVTISRFQRTLETMPKMLPIHHGLDLDRYPLVERKRPYLSFLGRIAPAKAPHLAIAVARRAGIPLKIAGEVQPLYRDYWEAMVKPQVDGDFIEFVGEADHATKVELLGNSQAMLFPIQWNEPFGLVMIEAMACGTPVVALPGGSVPEVVCDGVSGWVCRDVEEMATRARDLRITAASCRQHVAENFSLDLMVRRYEAVYKVAAAERQALRRPAPRSARQAQPEVADRPMVPVTDPLPVQ